MKFEETYNKLMEEGKTDIVSFIGEVFLKTFRGKILVGDGVINPKGELIRSILLTNLKSLGVQTDRGIYVVNPDKFEIEGNKVRFGRKVKLKYPV